LFAFVVRFLWHELAHLGGTEWLDFGNENDGVPVVDDLTVLFLFGVDTDASQLFGLEDDAHGSLALVLVVDGVLDEEGDGFVLGVVGDAHVGFEEEYVVDGLAHVVVDLLDLGHALHLLQVQGVGLDYFFFRC